MPLMVTSQITCHHLRIRNELLKLNPCSRGETWVPHVWGRCMKECADIFESVQTENGSTENTVRLEGFLQVSSRLEIIGY